jgi:hypothetical protein
MEIGDLYDLMQPLQPSEAVPEAIRHQFDTARSAFVYSWFDYELVTLAERHAYAVLEAALRDRIQVAGGDPSPARSLKSLYEMAFRSGCLIKSEFEIPSPFHPNETISLFEIIRMTRNDLAHGNTHLLPDGSLQMMRHCFDILVKLYPDTTNKDAA